MNRRSFPTSQKIYPHGLSGSPSQCLHSKQSLPRVIGSVLNVTSNHRGMSKLALKKRYVSELDADIRNDVIDDSLQTTYDKLKFTTPVINQLREELRILMVSISEFEYITNGRYSKLLSTPTGIKKLMYELFTGRGIFKDENIQYEIRNSIEKQWKMIGDKLFKSFKT